MDAVIRTVALDKLVPMRVDLPKQSGFLPVMYDGKKTGFEYYFGPLDQQLKRFERFGDSQITTSIIGNNLELISSMTFLKALAALSGAAYYDPQGNKLAPPASVGGVLSYALAQIKKTSF